jgi:hypothetical protein
MSWKVWLAAFTTAAVLGAALGAIQPGDPGSPTSRAALPAPREHVAGPSPTAPLVALAPGSRAPTRADAGGTRPASRPAEPTPSTAEAKSQKAEKSADGKKAGKAKKRK